MSRTRHRNITIEVPIGSREDPIPLLERLTVRMPEAAQLLSISRAAVYRLVGSGELEVARSGRKTLVIVASIKSFVERNRIEIASENRSN